MHVIDRHTCKQNKNNKKNYFLKGSSIIFPLHMQGPGFDDSQHRGKEELKSKI